VTCSTLRFGNKWFLSAKFSAIVIKSSSTFAKTFDYVKATSSIGWFKTPAISSTKRCTIGFPAIKLMVLE
jgi:hypothetical protein